MFRSRKSRRTLPAPFDTTDLHEQFDLHDGMTVAWDYATNLDPRSAESEVARWFLRGCHTETELMDVTSGDGIAMLTLGQIRYWLPKVKAKLREIFADVDLSPRFVVDGSPEAREIAERFTFHDKQVPLSKLG
ncbi:MAG TPA: hypothetical protein VK191_11210 [Symbiobacteriaceae bacterium]|nr:hypothetical protein [Symbiobacteriaceae bacterium]